MMQHPTPDDYVIATGKSHTVKDWLEKVFEIANLSIDEHVESDTRLFRPHEVPHLLGDCTKARTMLGWSPETNFEKLAEIMYKEDLDYVKSTL